MTDAVLSAALPPKAQIAPLVRDAAAMWASSSWRFSASSALLADVQTLVRWAEKQEEPLAELQHNSLATPAIDELAEQIRQELILGSGVAWVQGLTELSERALRLLYLKLGLALGDSIDTYGRLYDVRDTGVSYKEQAVPVSLTREATGIHTDSSAKSVLPHFIGLACVRQAEEGGTSRLVSAAWAHELLRAEAPELLSRLYGQFIRDIVTPGGQRDIHQVAENRFPIFSHGKRLCFRYMRFWIERGHERCGMPLKAEDRDALDALDRALAMPTAALTFRMAPGEFLWLDNTTWAHDRDAYRDAPNDGRLMVRMWLTEKNNAPV